MTYHVPCCFVLFQLKKKKKKTQKSKKPSREHNWNRARKAGCYCLLHPPEKIVMEQLTGGQDTAVTQNVALYWSSHSSSRSSLLQLVLNWTCDENLRAMRVGNPPPLCQKNHIQQRISPSSHEDTDTHPYTWRSMKYACWSEERYKALRRIQESAFSVLNTEKLYKIHALSHCKEESFQGHRATSLKGFK